MMASWGDKSLEKVTTFKLLHVDIKYQNYMKQLINYNFNFLRALARRALARRALARRALARIIKVKRDYNNNYFIHTVK